MDETKSEFRRRADAVKPYQCKNLIAVLEYPTDVKNIGTVIRNVNALGVEKTYIVDPKGTLPDDWQEMREKKSLSKPSVSAIKWSFVKRFDSTEDCFAHLEKNRFVSIVTSPHVKGKQNEILHYKISNTSIFQFQNTLSLSVYGKFGNIWSGVMPRNIKILTFF